MRNTAEHSRRTDIDALRVFATFLLFPFHVAMIFNPAPFYHVRNDALSIVALIFTGFVSLWHMPLFFVLAGWSAIASLRGRGTAAFARERITRLLVPLVVGCVVFAPAIKYIELRGGQDLNHRGLFVSPAIAESYRSIIPQALPAMTPFDEGFGRFLPSFFTDLDRFTWSHLWFVAYLFTLSLVWLPVLSRMASPPTGERRARAAGVTTLLVYLPIVPLAFVQVTMRARWPGIQNLYDDWANITYYSMFLLLGASLAARPDFEQSVHREWRRALVLGLLSLGGLLAAVLGMLKSEPAVLALTAVAGWSCIVVLLALMARQAPPLSAALEYWSEASMPVYVLHQPAIVFLAYFVVSWPLPLVAKFGVILLGSLAATTAAYHCLIQPASLLRVALGMKPLACPIPSSRARTRNAACAVILVLGLASDVGAATPSPEGLWWAEGGAAKVRLDRCGDSLCGRVVWLRSPFDERGCLLRDRYNSDPALRDRDVIGLEIVSNLVATDAQGRQWSNGTIYDPTSGRTYDCELRMHDDDRLDIRGYFGLRLIGRTVTWTRVGSEERLCLE